MEDPTLAQPDATEYAPPFANYVQKSTGDVLRALETQREELLGLLREISEQESFAKHAPYTWSVKEVVGHITDCERVFGHRALWIARGGEAPLPSFDEMAFMQAAQFDAYPFAELLDEFDVVRRSHLALFRHLQSDAWTRRGVVLNHPTTTRAMAHIIFGHTRHHLDILHKRLVGSSN